MSACCAWGRRWFFGALVELGEFREGFDGREAVGVEGGDVAGDLVAGREEGDCIAMPPPVTGPRGEAVSMIRWAGSGRGFASRFARISSARSITAGGRPASRATWMP